MTDGARMAKRALAVRAPLDRARIAVTAMEMIDEVGVEKLTMRAVAARLGVSAMALYHHVEDKDELLRLVGDVVLGRIELPDPIRTRAIGGSCSPRSRWLRSTRCSKYPA